MYVYVYIYIHIYIYVYVYIYIHVFMHISIDNSALLKRLQVIASTVALKKAQLAEDSAEDLATIPRVGIADLERKVL